ncbi:hypothetical protein BGZ76_011889 [Entomortierella beljakovae]|nr:hypothetical protein BGZ76_011889 [Entomortierella beljakovae]
MFRQTRTKSNAPPPSKTAVVVEDIPKLPSPLPESQPDLPKSPKPPLHGVSICSTGITINEREDIRRLVEEMGGKVSGDLAMETTHLIAKNKDSEKYKTAYKLGIPVISEKWIQDTYKDWKEGKPLNINKSIEDYVIGPLNGCQICVTGMPIDPADQEGVDKVENLEDDTLQIVPKSMYLEMCQIYLCPSFTPALISRFKKLIRMAGGIHIADYDPDAVTHVLVPSDKLDPATMALFTNDDAGLPYILNQQWLRDSNRDDKTLPESNYIVPFPTRTEDGQPKPVKFEGATTWTRDDLIEKKNTDGGSMAYRTKPEVSPATTPTKRIRSSSPSKLSPQQHRNGLRARTVSGILSDALDDLSMNKALGSFPSTPGTLGRSKTEPTEDEDTQVSNIFLGLYITSHGCKGAKMIQEQTMACGGTYFNETETPPADAPIKSIVPLSMPHEKTKNLPGVVMTICWFEKSLMEERVIPRNDFFLYKPMKNIPVQG